MENFEIDYTEDELKKILETIPGPFELEDNPELAKQVEAAMMIGDFDWDRESLKNTEGMSMPPSPQLIPESPPLVIDSPPREPRKPYGIKCVRPTVTEVPVEKVKIVIDLTDEVDTPPPPPLQRSNAVDLKRKLMEDKILEEAERIKKNCGSSFKKNKI